MNRIVMAGISALAAVVGASSVAGAQGAASLDALVAAAKKEGKVVFYNGTTRVIPTKIAEAFEKRYGIQVDILHGTSSQTRERISSEQASGRRIGDVVLNGIPSMYQFKQQGFLAEHGALPNASKLVAPFQSDGVMLPGSAGSFAILVNTDLVKPADYPKSWKDVTDPKWQGKILLQDPRSGGGGYVFFGVLNDVLGRGYHEAIAKMKPELASDSQVAQRRAARGEFSLYLPMTITDYPNLRGLPVKAIVPEEGAPYITTAIAVIKDAPHPNAARLFANFLLDDEVQTIYADAGARSSTGVKSDKFPPEDAAVYAPKLLATTRPEEFNDVMKLSSEIYK